MGDVPADDIPEGAIKITYWCVFPRTELPRIALTSGRCRLSAPAEATRLGPSPWPRTSPPSVRPSPPRPLLPRGAREPTPGVLGAVDDVEIYLTATADVTGFFEVEIIGGDMLHSRMNGDGFVDSQKKMDKIIEGIEDYQDGAGRLAPKL